ncbi:MAG: DUF4474 domain-containing protein [Lachnospiraceae bacterium]|nr:DUF4474 domain-containing protein [Lachnospiraceae bacterium]
MPIHEKCMLLNELVNPFGYCYDARQDIFTSETDAWQKKFGYGEIYDKLAPLGNMIFDCQPVYFDYDGKTWLIEFWKGQYGINTGSEVGVYRADTIIPPKERKTTIYKAVPEDEFPDMRTELLRKGKTVANISARHWWLTIFKTGCFSQPKDLKLKIYIDFPNPDMRDAFVDALILSGCCPDTVCQSCSAVSFTFTSSCRKINILKKLYRGYVQFMNRLFCRLYLFVTRPFCLTYDKILYLYYFLPFIFRRMFRIRRRKCRKCHKKRKG